jgi:hypothetical protein
MESVETKMLQSKKLLFASELVGRKHEQFHKTIIGLLL